METRTLADASMNQPPSSFIISKEDSQKGIPSFYLQTFKIPNQPDQLLCKFRFSVPAVGLNKIAITEREAKDYIFSIDISGSMGHKAGNHTKLDLVKQAIIAYIEKHAGKDDTISVVTFDSKGEQVITRCPCKDFLDEGKKNQKGSGRYIFDEIKTRGGTKIKTGITAISCTHFGPKRSKNKPVIFLLTDGQDGGKTDVEEIVAAAKERCGEKTAIHTIGFGPGYNRIPLNGIREQSGSALPDVVHIETAADVVPRIDFLANFIDENQFADFTVNIEVNGHSLKQFSHLIAKYDDVYALEFVVPKDTFKVEDGEPLAASANISYLDYRTPNMAGKKAIEIKHVKYKDDELHETEASSIKYINQKMTEIMADPVIAKMITITCFGGPSYWDFRDGTDWQKVLNQFEILYKMREELSAIEQVSEEANNVMNTLNDLLRTLATHYRAATIDSGSNREATNTVSNERMNMAVMTNTLPEGMRQQYQHAGARTNNANEQLLKGVSDTHHAVQLADDGCVMIKFDIDNKYAIPYKCIGGAFDWVSYRFIAKRPRYYLAYPDGSIENREILLFSPSESYDFYMRFIEKIGFLTANEGEKLSKRHETDKQALTAILQYTQKNLHAPQDEKDITKFNLAVFDQSKGLTLKNGRVLPCSEFKNFFLQGIKKCRHDAMAAVILTARAVQQGVIDEGTVNLKRSTAFNEEAHAFGIYEPLGKNEVCILDPLLGNEPYNLRNREQLLEVIKKYNALNLPGILLDLIKEKNLDEDHSIRGDQALFPIPIFSAATLEKSADELEDYACPITGEPALDPIRPMLVAGVNPEGQEELEESKHVYERAELEKWLQRDPEKTDPMTRRKIVTPLPDFDHPLSVKCRSEMYAIISKKNECSKPENGIENLTGVALPPSQQPSAVLVRKRKAKKKFYNEHGVEFSQSMIMPLAEIKYGNDKEKQKEQSVKSSSIYRSIKEERDKLKEKAKEEVATQNEASQGEKEALPQAVEPVKPKVVRTRRQYRMPAQTSEQLIQGQHRLFQQAPKPQPQQTKPKPKPQDSGPGIITTALNLLGSNSASNQLVPSMSYEERCREQGERKKHHPK